MRRKIVSILLAGSLAASLGVNIASAVGNTQPKWWYFHREARNPGAPAEVILRSKCFSAEDSAFHPKTLVYDGERIVIGCFHKGY